MQTANKGKYSYEYLWLIFLSSGEKINYNGPYLDIRVRADNIPISQKQRTKSVLLMITLPSL